jgi:uncharacterized YccA/Bax inhibitor family protein
MKTPAIVTTRPAETGGIGAAISVLIAYFAGVDNPAVIAALAVVVGAIPGIITWAVVTFRKEGK